MKTETLLIFLPACFALNLAPGPNNLLSLNNAARFGLLRATLAGGGRLLAFAGMLALAASLLLVQGSIWGRKARRTPLRHR